MTTRTIIKLYNLKHNVFKGNYRLINVTSFGFFNRQRGTEKSEDSHLDIKICRNKLGPDLDVGGEKKATTNSLKASTRVISQL